MRVTRLSRAVRATVLRKNPITIYTDSVTPDVFDPSWTFSDASLMTVDWGDGTPVEFNATGLNHTYLAAGRKTVKFTCPDWGKLATFTIDNDTCRLKSPSFSACTGMIQLSMQVNQFSDTFPILTMCASLVGVYAYSNLFNGILPPFPASLIELWGYDNHFSGYTNGGFAIQRDLNRINLWQNDFIVASIDTILADLVTSLAIPGRVVCNVDLSGGTSAPPSNPAGLADKATLIAAGWTVVTN